MLELIKKKGKEIILGHEMGSIACPKRYYGSQLPSVITEDVVIYTKKDGYFKEIARCPVCLKMYHFEENNREKILCDLDEKAKSIFIKEIVANPLFDITTDFMVYVHELINQGIISKDVFSIYKKDGVTQ